MLTLLWTRCPSVGAVDSLNVSVQSHYETEIVITHSWCQLGSCPDKNKIFNEGKKEKLIKQDDWRICAVHLFPTVILCFGISLDICGIEWQDTCGEGKWGPKLRNDFNCWLKLCTDWKDGSYINYLLQFCPSIMYLPKYSLCLGKLTWEMWGK